MPEPMIRLFFDLRGTLEGSGPDYTVSEYGGIVPSVGDCIVDPGVVSGLDRRDPSNRDVYIITARYFLPDANRPRIVLVAEHRRGHAREINIVQD